jgi:hypothetical protein
MLCLLISTVIVNDQFLFLFLQTSGVKVADACKIIYEEVKKDKKHRYVVFHIKDGKEIDVEVIGR